MRNPFVSYSPLDTQTSWIGDAKPFALLSDNMRNRNNVCILGVQGCGKTSLLQCFFNMEYIGRMALEEKTIICKVDLSLQHSGSDICQYLAERIKATARIWLTESAQYQMILNAFKADDATSPMALLENVIEILHTRGYHVVLIMDRFERFTASPAITMDHHETLRSLIEGNKLRCIVATNYDLSKDSLAPGVKGSYLMQKFTNNICLKGMSSAAAAQYIQNQQRDSQIQLPEGLIAKLTEISGGIPLLLEYAAECAYDNLVKNGGKIDGRELTAAIYEKARPILTSWCDSLTPVQIHVLKTLASHGTPLFDFTGCDDDVKKAVASLRLRGLVVAPDVEYNYEVRANSLLLQRFCKEELKEPEEIPQEKNALPEPESKPVPQGNTIIYNNCTVYSDNAVDRSSNLNVENLQINQGLSTSDLLQLLCGSDSAPGAAIDSRQMFASQLSAKLRKYIPDGSAPFQLPDPNAPAHVYAQNYDEKFNELSQKLVADVEVDQDEELVVTQAELQTLETRFEEARSRCRGDLTDAFLATQTERCQFYLKLSVIVEDALDLPGIQMDDYSPQLILYGKAFEQSLRDNFYKLFHEETKLSRYNTKKKMETQDKNGKIDWDVFANKSVKKTFIGNYVCLLEGMSAYLANLCQSKTIQTDGTPADVNAWTLWWEKLREDISDARDIRNLAAHTDPVLSPNKAHLDQMCELLLGSSETASVLRRTLVGKDLYLEMFPPSISFDVEQKFVGKDCRMKCKLVKNNGGLSGMTCDGGYPVSVSRKRVEAYCKANDCQGADFSGKDLIVHVIDCPKNCDKKIFGAEIVSVCT